MIAPCYDGETVLRYIFYTVIITSVFHVTIVWYIVTIMSRRINDNNNSNNNSSSIPHNDVKDDDDDDVKDDDAGTKGDSSNHNDKDSVPDVTSTSTSTSASLDVTGLNHPSIRHPTGPNVNVLCYNHKDIVIQLIMGGGGFLNEEKEGGGSSSQAILVLGHQKTKTDLLLSNKRVERKQSEVTIHPMDAAAAKCTFTCICETEAKDLECVLRLLPHVGMDILKMYKQMVFVSKVLRQVGAVKQDDDGGGISLDALRRCGLEDISYVRDGIQALEHGCVSSASAVADKSEGNGAGKTSNGEEIIPRVSFGVVDWFRLFVPTNEGIQTNANKKDESNSKDDSDVPLDVQQVITIVQRSSQYISYFASAMDVVQDGWHLPHSTFVSALKRRQSYDTDAQNIQHDIPAQNEYYEAVVGKDLVVNVHSKDHAFVNGKQVNRGAHISSKTQAFTLVNAYPLQFSATSKFHPDRDPVMSIPSLLAFIQKYPQHEFFVTSTMSENYQAGFVNLFVRTLPLNVDAPFDLCLEKFRHGSTPLKNRKLELFVNLGPGPGLSFLAWAALKTMNAVLSWSRRGEPDIPFAAKGQRTGFPGMTMSNYTAVKHFQGNNWLSHTCYLNPKLMKNWAAKILFERLEDGAIKNCILDFSYVLEGNEFDAKEFPERVVCSMRSVHINFDVSSVPLVCYENIEEKNEDKPATDTLQAIKDNEDKDNEKKYSTRVTKDDQNHTHKLQTHINLTDPQYTPLLQTLNALHGRMSRQVSHTGDCKEIPLLDLYEVEDLRRYLIACDCNVGRAVDRLIVSAEWKLSRSDLIQQKKKRNGGHSSSHHVPQVFHQGYDLCHNPILYFLNKMPGSWDKHIPSIVEEVITCVDETLHKHSSETKLTVIVVLGMPLISNCNPKEYSVHTNYKLVTELTQIMSTHYPERLAQCLVVPDGWWDTVLGTSGLFAYVPNEATRNKVVMIKCLEDLKEFVDVKKLSDIVGGARSYLLDKN